MPSLTVMLDAVAALRLAMHYSTPDPVAAALMAELAGADGIGFYLQEDLRYWQERDIRLLRQTVCSRLIMLMAPTSEMVGNALELKPERVIVMPEIQKERPQEIGLDLTGHGKVLYETVDTLKSNGISVGLCIQPEAHQAKLAHQLRADWALIQAGELRAANSPPTQHQALTKLIDCIKMAHKLRLHVAVGRGLDHRLIKLFRGTTEIDEFLIGRDIFARAILVGLDRAVQEMLALIRSNA
jgi:pyridoxine 5-phosphate synthase